MIADNKPGSKKKPQQGPAEKEDPLNPLGDKRFAAMFSNMDFELEEESEEFQRLHPILAHKDRRMKIKKKKVEEEGVESEVRKKRGGG